MQCNSQQRASNQSSNFVVLPHPLLQASSFIALFQLTMGVCPGVEMLQKLLEEFFSRNLMKFGYGSGHGRGKRIRGTVVIMKKCLLDFKDVKASILDRVHDFFGNGVSIQLISSNLPDSGERLGVGKLEKWTTTVTRSLTAEEIELRVFFEWEESMGVPEAFIIRNNHRSQFYLKTVTLQDVPGHGGSVHFVCNSWVYPVHRYAYDRVFFSNKSYLPSETPEPYNDLGMPDSGKKYVRTVLGGSSGFPYPRRGRTGRKPAKTDPCCECRLPLLSLDVYVPRDEQFRNLKFSDFLAYGLKSIVQALLPEIKSLCDKNVNEFDSFQDVMDLYEGGMTLPNEILGSVRELVPWQLFRELMRSDGRQFLKFPVPDVIKESKTAWRTDEEFGREMLAGVNPVVIRRLEEFPPVSKLDSKTYGKQNSSITEEHIAEHLNGLTVHQALDMNKLFILDHHDSLMPYISRINSTSTKTYATRTLFLLQDNGILKPLAMELSLPHPQGDHHGAVSKVFTPAESGVEGSVWQLAKAYVTVNDSGYHQLISHWLNTHAVIEPFIIATNRQVSVMHPIYKLLHPHFKDTMNINAMARQILINAGGILESTVFPGKYAMEMSAVLYRNWVFTDHALPTDLIKRGVAVPDPSSPHGLKLLIEDYPYAVDGLEIWSAIEKWVIEYCSLYYESDEMVQEDTEVQSWWTELRNVGHGDLKDEPWWPKMDTREDLIKSCTIIIWIASALHAAVNFGQYSYAGYLPNRPTVSRRFMPEPGTPEFKELETDPDLAYLKTITAQLQTLLGVSLIESLSRHSVDEIYLGQRDTPDWTSDEEAAAAFERFGNRLREIEEKIMMMNKDEKWKNRVGPVKLPYTFLFPNTSNFYEEEGLNARGIPNSVSI